MAENKGREIAVTRLVAGVIAMGETITISTVMHDDERRREYTGVVYWIGPSIYDERRDCAMMTVVGMPKPISIPLEPRAE